MVEVDVDVVVDLFFDISRLWARRVLVVAAVPISRHPRRVLRREDCLDVDAGKFRQG